VLPDGDHDLETAQRVTEDVLAFVYKVNLCNVIFEAAHTNMWDDG
jgi:hypothetical protein